MSVIFADGFESGDLTVWSSSVTDGGNLSASATAALHGSYGLSALINDTTAIYVQDTTPNYNTRYRARFYLDPNSISIPSGQTITVFVTYHDAQIGFWINLGYNGTNYTIQGVDYATGQYWSTSLYTITDAPHCIELDWTREGGVDWYAGVLDLYIDGTLKEHLTSIPNYADTPTLVNLGAPGVSNVAISGTLYLDDFASNNDGGEIGEVGSFSSSVSATPSVSVSVSVSATPSVSISLSPSVSASVSISATPSISVSVSPSISVSATPSISVSSTPSVSESISVSLSPSISVSATPSISPSVSVSATPSVSESISASATPSVSASVSISKSPSISIRNTSRN